uniref:Uncharacterized protein n=1 Tax=Anguilla anguilla TaxID=7936 RepID=A0A0E9S3F1_ANGAN
MYITPREDESEMSTIVTYCRQL